MKKYTYIPYFLFLLLFLTASCQTPEPVITGDDYTSGRQLAEAYAKEDAKKLHCMLYRRKAWRNIMSGNLKGHTDVLKSEKTEAFMNGFMEGYRKYYSEYADTYCGE